jgi:hypothetical protein
MTISVIAHSWQVVRIAACVRKVRQAVAVYNGVVRRTESKHRTRCQWSAAVHTHDGVDNGDVIAAC